MFRCLDREKRAVPRDNVEGEISCWVSWRQQKGSHGGMLSRHWLNKWRVPGDHFPSTETGRKHSRAYIRRGNQELYLVLLDSKCLRGVRVEMPSRRLHKWVRSWGGCLNRGLSTETGRAAGAGTVRGKGRRGRGGRAPRPGWEHHLQGPWRAELTRATGKRGSGEGEATAKAGRCWELTSTGTNLRRNRTPSCCMEAATFSAISWSKPRRSCERTMTVTSRPRPARKPAHSSATEDAPTTRVAPGQ